MKYEHLLSETVNKKFKIIVNEFFNKIHENKMSFVEENEELEETTDCAGVGNFGYDAPAFSDKETGNHSQIFRKSWTGNIKKNQKFNENFIKNNILKPIVEQYLLEMPNIMGDFNTNTKRLTENLIYVLEGIRDFNVPYTKFTGRDKYETGKDFLKQWATARNIKQYSRVFKYVTGGKLTAVNSEQLKLLVKKYGKPVPNFYFDVTKNYLIYSTADVKINEVDSGDLNNDIRVAKNWYDFVKQQIFDPENIKKVEERIGINIENRELAFEMLALHAQLYDENSDLSKEDQKVLLEKIKELEKKLKPNREGNIGEWYTAMGRESYNNLHGYYNRISTKDFLKNVVLSRLTNSLQKYEDSLRINPKAGNRALLAPKINDLKNRIDRLTKDAGAYFADLITQSNRKTKMDYTSAYQIVKDAIGNEFQKLIQNEINSWRDENNNKVTNFLSPEEIASLEKDITDAAIVDAEDGVNEDGVLDIEKSRAIAIETIETDTHFTIDKLLYNKKPKYKISGNNIAPMPGQMSKTTGSSSYGG
jgi:hypothetical protein